MQNIFKEAELSFSTNEGRLKVEGLSNLPGNRADEIRQKIRENKKDIMLALRCPARCKQTGRCYGIAYFQGKTGSFPGPECDYDQCEWQAVNNK